MHLFKYHITWFIRKKQRKKDSLVGTWVDRANSTREYLRETWLHPFLLPAPHYIAGNKLGVILPISSEYVWLCSKRPLRAMALTAYVLCNTGSKSAFQEQFRDVFWHFFPFLFKMYCSVTATGTQILSGNNTVSKLAFCLTKSRGVCPQLGDEGNSCLLGKRYKAGVQKFLFSLNILLLSSSFSCFHLLSQAWWALDSPGKRADLARKARTIRSESLSFLIGSSEKSSLSPQTLEKWLFLSNNS